MRKRKYREKKKNVRAVNILRSWLRAAGIKMEAPDRGDLKVIGPNGPLEVIVKVGEDAMESAGCLVIEGRAVTGKNPTAAAGVLDQVLLAAGVPSVPAPIRPAGELNASGNIKKLHYGSEDFLVTIRHNEFRRAPNPPEDRWAKYKGVMEIVVRTWLKNPGNRELCARSYMDEDDLMQMARCYVVNFVASTEIPNPVDDDNERVLVSYLRQRFNNDLRSVLLKKQRSCTPDYQTVAISTGYPAADPTDAYIYALDHYDLVRRARRGLEDLAMQNLVDRDELESKEALQAALRRMPHEDMVKALDQATGNDDQDVKTEAERQLQKHRANCLLCVEGRQVAEQLPG